MGEGGWGCPLIPFRIFVNHVTIFSSSPMQQARCSLWQEISNSWKVLLTVVTKSFVVNMTGLLGVIHLWRSQKMTNFLTPAPPPSAKMSNRSLVLKNRICKHVSNFKTPPPHYPFRVDVIDVWSPRFNSQIHI